MKKIFALALLLTLSISAFSQTQRDVVSLKNGSVIKGNIIEQTPPVQLKIETADGSIFVFKYDDIATITKETVPVVTQNKVDDKIDFKNYGGKLSLGISMGGGGVVGAPIRFYPARRIAFEVAANLRPTYFTETTTAHNQWGEPIYTNQKTSFHVPVMMSGGVHFLFGESYNPWKQRIYRNGVTFTAGKSTAEYRDNFIAFGWSHERFNKVRHKYAFESQLGVAAFFFDDESPLANLDLNTHVIPTLYWKFHWSWFVK